MGLGAILWVSLSAVAHVSWNALVRRSQAPEAFAWLVQAVGVPIAFATAFALGRPLAVPPLGWLCVAGTGFFYGAYYTLIARGYRHGDLSVVYPVARGIAPAATVAWGMLFFRERPTALGLTGIALIVGAVGLAAYPEWRRARSRIGVTAILLAVATGLCTSGYSAIDKEGVGLVDPVLYIALCFAAGSVAQAAILAASRRFPEVVPEARRSGGLLAVAAAANLGGYLIILFVLQTQPVSYVVPLRSVAVLLSVGVGVAFLHERAAWPRALAACLVFLGIVAIAFA